MINIIINNNIINNMINIIIYIEHACGKDPTIIHRISLCTNPQKTREILI